MTTQTFKCNNSKSTCPIALKFDTVVISEAIYAKNVND